MKSMSTGLGQTDSSSSMNAHYFTAVVLLAWFSLIVLLGQNGFFIPEAGQPPAMLFVTGGVALALFGATYRYHSAFRSYVLNLDMRLLVMLHGTRTLGLGFVMLYSIGQLPAFFALMAGFGDAITAVWAIAMVYYWITHQQGLSRKALLRWNHFGLLDFALALGIGALSQTGGLFHIAGGPSNDLVVMMPIVLIPGFLVQVLVITHIIIYLQLRNNWKDQDMIKVD